MYDDNKLYNNPLKSQQQPKLRMYNLKHNDLNYLYMKIKYSLEVKENHFIDLSVSHLTLIRKS